MILTDFYRAYVSHIQTFGRSQIVLGVIRTLLWWLGYFLLAIVDWRIAIGMLCLRTMDIIYELEKERYK